MFCCRASSTCYITDLLEQQGNFKRLEIWLPDHPAADILRHLPAAVAFVPRRAGLRGARAGALRSRRVSQRTTVQPPHNAIATTCSAH